MVQSWYGGWNIWVYIESAWEAHIVLLYEWQQNYFETKEPIGREWCKILQKARTAKPSATTMWQMSFLWKDLNTRKQHVENISQMYGKNIWGFCQRSNPKKTRSAHPFEGARYWLGCSRSILPCHLSERLHSRGWQTPGNHQRLKPLKSKLPTGSYTNYFQYIVLYVMGRLFRDKEITTWRKIMKLEHSMHLLCRGK